jgi:hypothetical protein
MCELGSLYNYPWIDPWQPTHYGGALERSRSKSPYRCHTPKCVIGDRQAIRLVPACSHFLQPCFPESDVGLARNGYAEVLFLAKGSIDFARVDCACCCRGSPEPATGAPSGPTVANQTPHTQLSLPALADFEAVLRSRSRFRPNPTGTTTFLGGRLAIEFSLAHRSRLGILQTPCLVYEACHRPRKASAATNKVLVLRDLGNEQEPVDPLPVPTPLGSQRLALA